MWFDEIGEIIEMFKGSFPLSFLFFVPIFIIISGPVSPVHAAQDFAVFRMQQYDLQGSSFGCKSSLVNMEARSIDSKMLTRRCAVARLQDVTMPKFRDIMTQNAGALLILLPSNLTQLSADDKQHLQRLEEELLQEPCSVPVYFAHESENLLSIYKDVQEGSSGDNAPTAWEALLSSATANGFQLVISGSQAEAVPDFEIANIQGRLSGYGIEEQLPTIVVTAHYDSSGIAPALSYGVDSNGSGVAILLELVRLMSKLYTNSRTHAKYNIVFLLSGGGKFNYQGSKRWIEDNVEATEGNLLTDVAFVLCLDTIGKGNNLNLHVSKPPKEDSAGGQFYKHLEEVSKANFPEVKVDMIHKKINLADETLAWEHERFSIKRMLAFTLSHLNTHKDQDRSSIVDQRDAVSTEVISRNAQIIAEALARQVYSLSVQGNFQMFTDTLSVDNQVIESWLNYLSSKSRAAQLMPPESEMVMTLEQTMEHYLKDVKKVSVKADKRDPEYVFYSGTEYNMNAYNVKPAVFDLFLAIGIAGYLALSYFVAQNFNIIYYALKKTVAPTSPKTKAH